MKRRKTRRRQCGKGIGTLFTTLAPKVLRILGTKIIPALGLGAMEGLGRKMVGGRKKGRTLRKRTPCAMIRPQHLHKLKPYASMLRSKLNAKQIRALNRVRTHKRAAIIPLTKNQKGGFIGAMLASLGIPILMKALGIWFFVLRTYFLSYYILKITVYTVTSVSFLCADLGSSVGRVPYHRMICHGGGRRFKPCSGSCAHVGVSGSQSIPAKNNHT